MPKKIAKELKLTVIFRPSRVEDRDLAKAYEIARPLEKNFIKTEEITCFQENCLFQHQDKDNDYDNARCNLCKSVL